MGAVAGRRPAVPRGSQGRNAGRHRRDRRRLLPGRGALRRGRIRRDRIAVLALLDRARLPVGRHEPPHRRLRRVARAPGPHSRRDHRCGQACDREPAGARRAAVRRRADRARHHDRRCGSSGRDRRGDGSGRLHQHLDRRRHCQPVHDRGLDACPPGLCDVHPFGDPQGGRPSRRRCRPVQGSTPGRACPGRGSL